jgi:hypothetical protein
MADRKKIFRVSKLARFRQSPGGGSLELSTVFKGTPARRDFVTARAGFAGGAVPNLCSLIPLILPGPVIFPAGY